MSNNLIIVESPAKAKTIKKYLGKDFQVLASYGHVRDLPSKTGAIKPDEDFKDDDFVPHYEIIERNAKHVSEISKALKKADALYLATDPDREGEAISWHLYEFLKEKKLLKDKPVQRVVFHEITKKAVTDAVANARDIAMDLVNAQQARRALDYLVGFNLSPLLWKKVRRGLSAGRVQSPALCMIVQRELEIEAFDAKEYWTIEADLMSSKTTFLGKLTEYESEKVKQFTINNEKDATAAKTKLTKAANGKLTVVKVDKKQRKRNPAAPFITSTLQQEAARKLGFSAQKTMRTAQQLYEGIDVGEGSPVGLISYMRTDSVNLAEEALVEIRDVIAKEYGADNVPSESRSFKSKVKNAQEAHEAIRPTSAARRPKDISAHLSREQLRLYDLIWKRTIASQMIHATMHTVSVDMSCGEGNLFRANGSTIAIPGFLSVYQEGLDDAAKEKALGEEKLLPELKEGDEVELKEIRAEQHFTEPPPRYSEASLIKTLEEYGIGRPSTYASIISTLINREYVTLEQKRFQPTDVGKVVSKFLTEHFTTYVDYGYTASLEDTLDAISRGEQKWIPMLREFWGPFTKQIDLIEETVSRQDVTHEAMDEDCPKCGKPLSTRLGKRGRFVGCTGYPDCDYTRNMDGEETTASELEVVEDRKCPKCESDLIIRHGRYGKFIGCSAYPKCKHIESLEKPKELDVDCPECNKGKMMERKSRYGKIFFSCSRYPDCKYAMWNEPLNQPCGICAWPVTCIKTTKRNGTERVCPRKTCKFSEPAEPPESSE